MRRGRFVSIPWLIALAACHEPRAPLADAGPDAMPDAQFQPVCPGGEPVTITGTTPRGGLAALGYRNVTSTSGFCNGISVHYTREPVYGYPEPLPILSAHIGLSDNMGLPMGGDIEAIVRFIDGSGAEVEATGTFMADEIEPLGKGSRLRGRLLVDDPGAGWAIDLAVDATSCNHTSCF